MELTAEMSRRIEERIDAFVASEEWHPDLRNLAARLRALPLYSDVGGCIALRGDGEVILVDPDYDGSDSPASRRWALDGGWPERVLRSGCQRHPELVDVLEVALRR